MFWEFGGTPIPGNLHMGFWQDFLTSSCLHTGFFTNPPEHSKTQNTEISSAQDLMPSSSIHWLIYTPWFTIGFLEAKLGGCRKSSIEAIHRHFHGEISDVWWLAPYTSLMKSPYHIFMFKSRPQFSWVENPMFDLDPLVNLYITIWKKTSPSINHG